MKDYKLFKDPLYGYVQVNKEYCEFIVDTPTFQRLKDIRQTSYLAVYPNSSHSRFIHSIGVFYLARLAYPNLKKNSCYLIDKLSLKRITYDKLFEKHEKTFEIAALLHDVGHAPFSHTGENFYLLPTNDGNVAVIYDSLVHEINNLKRYSGETDIFDEGDIKVFIDDFKKIHCSDDKSFKKAASHEIMSCIIALRRFTEYFIFNSINPVLLCRMILGLIIKGENGEAFELLLKNCLISIINSSLVDVDRLDYLMRDIQMTGLNGIDIDYQRLLSSVCVINDKDAYFGFTKHALSTLQNVILSHDLERKWVQNHPVITYDAFLIKEMMSIVFDHYLELPNYNTNIDDNAILNIKSFQNDGVNITKDATEFKLRYASDGDFLFLAKQFDVTKPQYKIINEYFDRAIRKKPIWKSENEYNVVKQNITKNNQIKLFELFREYFSKSSNPRVTEILSDKAKKDELLLNDDLLEYYQDLYDRTQNKGQLTALQFLKELKAYVESKELFFSVQVIYIKKFFSNLNIFTLKKVYIRYESFDKNVDFEKTDNLYSSVGINNKENNEYVYFYISDNKTGSLPKGFSNEFSIKLNNLLQELQ